MSYGLRVYLVDETIGSIPGSNDIVLLEEILEVCANDLKDYDRQEDVEEGAFTHAQALRELFAGECTRPEYGAFYGWAFDILCSSLGAWLHNTCTRWPTDWLDKLDTRMAEGGVNLRFFGGLMENRPVPLPETPFGIPGIGHWKYEQVVAELPKLEAMLAGVTDKKLLESFTEDILPWLKASAERPNSMLIGVYG